MTIIRQLIQFIFYRRLVKDIDYDPRFALQAFLADAFMILLSTLVVNRQGLDFGTIIINHVPIGLSISYAVLFAALLYSFYAAQEKQARFVQAATAFFGASAILAVANFITSPLPGSSFLGLFILGIKISCFLRVVTESLDYGLLRTVFSLIGISLMAMLVSSMIFPIEFTEVTLNSK